MMSKRLGDISVIRFCGGVRAIRSKEYIGDEYKYIIDTMSKVLGLVKKKYRSSADLVPCLSYIREVADDMIEHKWIQEYAIETDETDGPGGYFEIAVVMVPYGDGIKIAPVYRILKK